jgi:hypothetical protein
MTVSTSGTGTAYPSEAFEFTHSFSEVCFAQSLLFCVLFCLFCLFFSPKKKTITGQTIQWLQKKTITGQTIQWLKKDNNRTDNTMATKKRQ